MTKEAEFQLLIKDLSARVPYGVYVEYDNGDGVKRATKFHGNYLYLLMIGQLQWKEFKPYLRSMSSMTESEKIELSNLFSLRNKLDFIAYGIIYEDYFTLPVIDWLNEHHFDYRGLIEMGLAIEAKKELYELKLWHDF